MLKWQKENLIPVSKYYTLSEQAKEGKLVIGPLHHSNYPEYSAEYAKIIEACKEAKKGK